MRKDNRDKQSGAAAILLQSSSGLTRGSRLNNKAIMFDVDSRVKPENDVIKRGAEGDRGGNENGCGWKRCGGAAAVLTISAMFCLGAGEAMAQCAVPPTCESLGYNNTQKECNGLHTLKCPFDQSKIFCNTTACSDTHTLSSCPARSVCTFCDSNKKYKYARCDLGYMSYKSNGCNEICATCSMVESGDIKRGYKYASPPNAVSYCSGQYISISYSEICRTSHNFEGGIMHTLRLSYNSQKECQDAFDSGSFRTEFTKRVYEEKGLCPYQ